MNSDTIRKRIEAALLASPKPLTLAQIHDLFKKAASSEDPIPRGAVEKAMNELMQQSNDQGIALVEVASGWRYQVREEYNDFVSALWTERTPKYSRALLETLAIIAYKQPVTRGDIESIRGVAVSSNMIRTLEEREWIRGLGHREVPGRPALYGTTKLFLDYFNLKSLDQLPALSDLKDYLSIDPGFDFENSQEQTSSEPDKNTDEQPTPVGVQAPPSSTAEE